MRVHILTAALLFPLSISPDAGQPLSIAVSPAQLFAPTNLTSRIHVEPHGDNRALEVIAESDACYRSGRMPIDGSMPLCTLTSSSSARQTE